MSRTSFFAPFHSFFPGRLDERRSLITGALAGVVLVASLVLGTAGTAGATVVEASTSAFTGDSLTVTLRVDDEADPGKLVITLEVDGEETGDLRGFFTHVDDESLLSGLSITGSNVTYSEFSANSVINLGRGNNLNGGGSPCPCDLGVEIGSPGIGTNDIQSTTFTISHSSVDLDVSLLDGQEFGVRATSVGDVDSSRDGSTKQIGVVPEPSTAILIGLGLAALTATGHRPRQD